MYFPIHCKSVEASTIRSQISVGIRAILAISIYAVITNHSIAQDTEPTDHEHVEEIVVVGDLGSIPTEEVESVFGFGKSLKDTPRSASSVSEEMLERFLISDIDELISLTPGSFTQSFFGVAGSLDIRGTPGETYFRGIRRLDNPGNYPTPIAASSRIDIVRGPPSPIHGPAKIGGYLDFYPKSAHVDSHMNHEEISTGSVAFESGSWQRRIGKFEFGGLRDLSDNHLGYRVFGEIEDSGSYYNHTSRSQRILQASFDLDFDQMEWQFGGMYHRADTNEIGGWNRITQELIDHGTYVAGTPQPLDANGDGFISHQEFDVNNDGWSDLSPFIPLIHPGATVSFDPSSNDGTCMIGETPVFGCFPELLSLSDVEVTTIDGSQVLVDPLDQQASDVLTLYFDVILWFNNGWEVTNQLFFETYDILTEVALGFSQFHDSWVIEDKLIFNNTFEWEEKSLGIQVSPSVRYTDFLHADDFVNEHFDRPDLTKPRSAEVRRLLATQIDADYTTYADGDYLDLGFAVLTDFDWQGLNVLTGLRYDKINVRSREIVDKLLLPTPTYPCADASCIITNSEDDPGTVSWTVSISWNTPWEIRPYFTASQQGTVVAGQGAEITPSNVATGHSVDDSRLSEVGVKGNLLEDTFYFAVSKFRQERTDAGSQMIVTNQATETTGMEFELRWLVNEKLLVSATRTTTDVININTIDQGGRFSFIGADDVPGVPMNDFYGGTLSGFIAPQPLNARRAGMPENIWSATATYNFGNGLAINFSSVAVAATESSFSRSIKLPAYTLVNLGAVYEFSNWKLGLSFKNVTDERYFRANFPNLFGGVIVLPELPRNFALSLQYDW